jgi:hypothetical protein
MIPKLLMFALGIAATFGIFATVSSQAKEGGCLCGQSPRCLHVSPQQCATFPRQWGCRWSPYCPVGITGTSSCRDAANAMFPLDSKTRREFRHWCRVQYRS